MRDGHARQDRLRRQADRAGPVADGDLMQLMPDVAIGAEDVLLEFRDRFEQHVMPVGPCRHQLRRAVKDADIEDGPDGNAPFAQDLQGLGLVGAA
jgi:hypothetical protein